MLQTAAIHARKALSAPRYYAGGLLKVFSTEPVFLWAQAIAFKTLVTLLPLLLLAAGIFGMVLRQEDPFTTVSEFLRAFLPRDQSDGLVQLVLQLQEASGAITLFGAVFFLITVITMFATLRYVVGAAMGESRHQMRSIVGGYLFDLRLAAQVGTLFLLSFGITAGARVLSSRSASMAATAGLDAGAVSAVTGGLLYVVTLLVPYALTVGMLAQLYHLVPRPRAPLRSAFWGAAAAAVLFELAKNGFAYYATYVADFDRYADQGEGLGGLGGAFGVILAFVFWVYLSGLILVAGAVVTGLHEKRNRPRRARLRHMWARKEGAFRKHRARVEAEAAEAVAVAHPSPGDEAEDAPSGEARPAPAAAPGGDGAVSAVTEPEPGVSSPETRPEGP